MSNRNFNMECGKSGMGRTAFFCLISILFLVISYTPYHHWDEIYYIYTLSQHSLTELLTKENELSAGLFPRGFFSSKIGSMFIIWQLVQILGAGWLSLYVIQFVFALFLIGFFLSSYKFYRELTNPMDSDDSEWALTTSMISLFLPVTLYLGFKTLTEVPALCFSTFGSWMFLKSIRETDTRKICIYLFCAFLGIALGTMCRLIFILNFLGLVFSYAIVYRKSVPIKKIICRASIVLAGFLALFVLVTFQISGHLLDAAGPLKDVIELKKEGTGVKIYVFMMFFQFFAFLLPFSFRRPWNRPLKMSVLWICVFVVPLFIVAKNLEPRYFSFGLLPVGIIAHQGLRNFVGLFPRHRKKIFLFSLVLMILLNRILFTPISLYEIDQKQFKKIVSDVFKHEPQSTLILPWVTDYCFLKFVYPDKTIRSAITRLPGTQEDNLFVKTGAFQWWIGKNNHISSHEELLIQSKPWIFIGRPLSPAREKLYSYLELLGLNRLMQRSGEHHPLASSWIWDHAALKLDLYRKQGPYNAYRIDQTMTIPDTGE